MNFFTFAKLGRTLVLSAVVAVGLLSVGCGGDDGGDDNPANNNSKNNNNNNNNNNGGGSVPIEKWMKKNLDVETDEGSWCYDGDPANCDKYGRLYTWEAAKAACQLVGMRLPTRAEWNDLVDAIGAASAGKKLKSRSGWDNNGNGTDEYGFSALPGGYRRSDGGFSGAGGGGWWTATEYDGRNAYYRFMIYDYDGVGEEIDYKVFGYSVRCVKDA